MRLMTRPRDSEYAQAARDIMLQWLRGRLTKLAYYERLEHLAAVHNQHEDRRRWAEKRGELEAAEAAEREEAETDADATPTE